MVNYLFLRRQIFHLAVLIVVTGGMLAYAITDPTILAKVTATAPNNILSTSEDYLLQSNQQVLADNQTAIMTNQYGLSLNQSYINKNIEEWVGSAVTEQQMKNLLLDDTLYEDGYQNLVDQLQQVLENTSDILPSLYQEQAVNLFQAADQSSTMAQVHSRLMSDTVSYILSGAGNANGSDTLYVSDVLSNVVDPSEATVAMYNTTIYPFVAIAGTEFIVSTCGENTAESAGVSQAECNLMKQILYTQLLVNSCSSSYVAQSSDASTASTSTSTFAQANTAASSQASGPSFDPSICPSGTQCGCSAAYYQTQYESWNGWNRTLKALNDLNSLCKDFSASSSGSGYADMTASIQQACSGYQVIIENADMQSGKDNSSNAQEVMANVVTPISDLVKYNRRLLVRKMYEFNLQKAVAKNSDMAYYGSLYTVLGPLKYGNSTAGNQASTPVSADLTPALSQDCVELIHSCKEDLTVKIFQEATDQSKLAYNQIMQLGSMYPMRTILAVPSLPLLPSSAATVAMYGQLVGLDKNGTVISGDLSTTTTSPQIEQNVLTLSASQSKTQSQIITASTLFSAELDSYLKNKSSAITAFMESYAKRHTTMKISCANSSTVCSLSPAQLQHYSATWRLNPQVKFIDAASSSDSTNATWLEHVASTSPSELQQTIAVLQSQLLYSNYLQQQQDEKMLLVQTLVPLQNSSAQASSMKQQSAVLDKLTNNYISGIASSDTSSSIAASSG